jgi:hypothetical protein
LLFAEFWLLPLPLANAFSAPLRWIDCRMRETSLSKDRGVAAGRDFEKNRSCVLPRGIVDAAAGRSLADSAARVGTTGRLPSILRPLRKTSLFTATAAERPVPKCPAGTVEIPSRTLEFMEASRTLE